MRLIIFSQPSAFIRGHLHAQLEHGWWHRAITIQATLGRGFRVFLGVRHWGVGSKARSLYTGVPYTRLYSSRRNPVPRIEDI